MELELEEKLRERAKAKASFPGATQSVEIVDFLSLPKPNYQGVWDFQKERVAAVAEGQALECIIFCEHELVVTKGRRSKPENVIDPSIRSFPIERGGDVTLHAPGQLVIYPILKLHGEHFRGGLNEYLRFCEEVLIEFLTSKGLKAGRFGPTGVWVQDAEERVKKIASIGIAVRRWITYHGIALNITNVLQDFQKIRPCDFEASIMTSLAAEGVRMSVQEVASELGNIFVRRLTLRS